MHPRSQMKSNRFQRAVAMQIYVNAGSQVARPCSAAFRIIIAIVSAAMARLHFLLVSIINNQLSGGEKKFAFKLVTVKKKFRDVGQRERKNVEPGKAHHIWLRPFIHLFAHANTAGSASK